MFPPAKTTRDAFAPKELAPRGPFLRAVQAIGRVYSVRRKIATAAAALLALGMGYHVVFGQNGLIVYEQKRQDAKTLDTELKNLERENDRLKGHVDRLQSDPDAIEHEAREELHYTRPGEVIYTLPPDPPSTGAPVTPPKK